MSFDDTTDAKELAYKLLVAPNGQETTVATKTAIPLKYFIRIKGDFTDDGFAISEVTPGGPATRMTSPDGSLTDVAMEPGDTQQTLCMGTALLYNTI
jgi:hypothetical protein